MGDLHEFDQPQQGVWLSPGKRIGHLVVFLSCSDKSMEYDKMADAEKLKATFEFVDLDQEGVVMVGYDNHPGITMKLKVDHPRKILGRIGTAPSTRGNDAVVLMEYTPEDAMRAQQHLAKLDSQAAPIAQPAAQAQYQQTSPQPAPAPAAPAAQEAPAPPPGLPTLDAGTLELLQRALLQQQQQGKP
jgi:hypothetical protein